LSRQVERLCVTATEFDRLCQNIRRGDGESSIPCENQSEILWTADIQHLSAGGEVELAQDKAELRRPPVGDRQEKSLEPQAGLAQECPEADSEAGQPEA
jgi:hypothetical protein